MVKRKRRSNKKAQSKGLNMGFLGSLFAPVAYGYVRENVSDFIANSEVGRKLPASQFTDEGVMLALNWGMGKMGLRKNPLMASVLRAQKNVELARIGQTIKDLQSMKQMTVSSNPQQVAGLLF